MLSCEIQEMEAIPVLPFPGYQFGGGGSTNGIGGLPISESLLGGIFSKPAVPFFAS